MRTYRTGRFEDVDVIYKYRTDNLKAVEDCIKVCMREHQYRKYREVYEADIDMIKGLIKRCDGATRWTQEFVRKKKTEMQGGYFLVVDRGDV